MPSSDLSSSVAPLASHQGLASHEGALWTVVPPGEPSAEVVAAVKPYVPEASVRWAAQLLWQRGIREIDELQGFVDPHHYEPTSPFAFGDEMVRAVERLKVARQRGERVAIWGDFDADGVTATSVLWDGLGQFFDPGDRLLYFIPNRLTDSHGLSMHGLDELAQQGVTLIVTCDTGSTNRAEIDHAHALGLEVIVTDHHTLPSDRPPVVAMVNPRSLPADHALAHLSGVAVAYKLVEALYQALPEVPSRPLDALLDLVAIGLIADLVELKGDCRYLAQRGIARLKTQTGDQPSRPGVAALLQRCRRTGDRPTDISFGIGPRINAISRIHGDASFGVELLTSQDVARCEALANETELANSRRKALQQDILNQVEARLADLDLSTTRVIVLADRQWPTGILGLVAGQIAQRHGRPTILLTVDDRPDGEAGVPLARGSARSVHRLDLYQLVHNQAHLLHRFGGHPFAAGMSLPAATVPLFAEAINQDFRARYGSAIAHQPAFQADLVVTVADLGPDLFRALTVLEPCGMGNPAPRLLVENCWFSKIWHRRSQDARQQRVNYMYTTFKLEDDTTPGGFPGIWWGHYKEELPQGRCDALVELDFMAVQGQRSRQTYQVRLIDVRPRPVASPWATVAPLQHGLRLGHTELLDWRATSGGRETEAESHDGFQPDAAASQKGASMPQPVVTLNAYPQSWGDFFEAVMQARQQQAPLAIAYPPPPSDSPAQTWQCLVGIAKHLDRTQKPVTLPQMQQQLHLSDRTLHLGIEALTQVGFWLSSTPAGIEVQYAPERLLIRGEAQNDGVEVGTPNDKGQSQNAGAPAVAIQRFLQAVGEERFRQRYFYETPVDVLWAIATTGDRPDVMDPERLSERPQEHGTPPSG